MTARELTAAEQETLWQLDCAVPKRVSQQVRPKTASQLRLRNPRSEEYAALRKYAVGLLAAGVAPAVLAVELDMSIKSMQRWADGVPSPRRSEEETGP